MFLIDVHHFKNGRFDTNTGLGMLITVKTTICCNSILCQQRKINLHTALARVSERMSFEQLTIFSNHAYSSHMCSLIGAVPFILINLFMVKVKLTIFSHKRYVQCTAMRILETLPIQTSSLFVKI